MWKTRKPPVALDFDEVSSQANGISSAICDKDQKIWDLYENYVVFADRYVLYYPTNNIAIWQLTQVLVFID